MKLPKNTNLPLIEIVMGSLLLHILALVTLGGITIYQNTVSTYVSDLQPNELQEEEEQKTSVQVGLKLKKSQTIEIPVIQVADPIEFRYSNIEIDVIEASTPIRIAGYRGEGGATLGPVRITEQNTLDLTRSAVNFFGIRSQGERVLFVIDASEYILEDNKGGLNAYSIVKREIVRMVEELAPGTLFNVMLFAGQNVQAYSPSMVPATPDNQDKLETWIQPFNSNPSSLGVTANIQLKNQNIAPMNSDVRNWPKAIQIALEQQADNVFLLSSSRWQFHPKTLGEEELKKWLKNERWGDTQEARWQKRLAEATNWLNNENRKRMDKGLAPRIVPGMDIIVKELYPRQRIKPAPAFDAKEVLKHIRNVNQQISSKLSRQMASVNVVIFQGENESRKTDDLTQFKKLASGNRGKFRTLYGMEDLKDVTSQAARFSNL